MKEVKLALIGKNISHSQSARLYEKYYPCLKYDLIDIQDESDLPNIDKLSKKYMGVNITAPFKGSYFGKETPVNTIKLGANPKGILTDQLAFEEIWKRRYHKLGDKRVSLLGDGVMGNMVANVLSNLKVDFIWCSRKKKNLHSAYLNHVDLSNEQSIIINTCSRDYIFDQELSKYTIFWDFNYNYESHLSLNQLCHYIDGLELLERQAFHTFKFWDFSLV